MEFALMFLLLVVAITIWLIASAVRRGRQIAEIQDSLPQLTSRIYNLENAVGQLRGSDTSRFEDLRTRIGDIERKVELLSTATGARPESNPAATSSKTVTLPLTPESDTERRLDEALPSPLPPDVKSVHFASSAPPAVAAPSPIVPKVEPVSLVPEFSATSAQDMQNDQQHNWVDIEERLGTNWLNKIGVTAFVIGVALLLNYSMQYLGPSGKIVLGYFLSIVFLGVGIVSEQRERYRIAGRAVLGGGWALAYFTTYALHNIAAVRLVTSPVLGFVLLFAVALAMVVHSLRYQSQVVTGFAYLLAFATVAVDQIPIGGLVASALLAASLVFALRHWRWYTLEPLAIVATYGLHLLWLQQVFERIGGHRLFPEFNASVALLSVYWILFLVSHFLRDDKEDWHKQMLTGSFLLNAAGYLAVLRYQSFYPQWRFWFLLGVGVVYLGVSAYAWRARRRLSYLLASTLGTALVLVAIPYRYSAAPLELVWLAEAEALLFIGWRLKDTHLRNLGWAVSGLVGAYTIFHDLWPRLQVWRAPDHPLGWLLVALAAAFYVNVRFKTGLGDLATDSDNAAATVSPYVATGFLLAAAWVALPFLWVALVWAIVGTALGESGRWLGNRDLRLCAYGAGALSALRSLYLDLLPRLDAWRPPDHTIGFLLLALAATFYWNGRLKDRLGESTTETDRHAAAVWPYVATVFLLGAAWVALPLLWVALVWAMLGIVLGESARRLHDLHLRVCAHSAAAFAAARLLSLNLNRADMWHHVSLRLVTVASVAGLFYLISRRSEFTKTEEQPGETRSEPSELFAWFGHVPDAYTYTASLLVALLIWSEVTAGAVALAWGLLALALLETGRALQDRALRMQCHILLAASFARIFFADLNSAASLGYVSTRLVTVLLLAAIYYYAASITRDSASLRTALLWFGTASLAALARFEFPLGWVAVAWAALAVVLYGMGRRLESPTLRYQSYVLTLLVGVRCAFDNFYQVEPWHFTTLRVATVIAASALLYILFAAAQVKKHRRGAKRFAAGSSDRAPNEVLALARLADHYPEHLFFFVPGILLTVLLSLEVRRGYLTAAWGVEGFLIFLAVLKMDERAYRWFSLLLFFLSVGRIILVDVWTFDPLGRIASFMGVGAALLLVSFLYARHREILGKVL